MAERKSIDPNLLIIGGVAALAYFGILDPILKKLGIKDDAADRARDSAIDTAANARGWNPTYYKSIKGALILTRASAESFARVLNSAMSGWGTNEEKIYGVLRSMKTQTQLSFLCDVYFQLYKKDLYQHIVSELSTNELAVVSGIVNKMPAK